MSCILNTEYKSSVISAFHLCVKLTFTYGHDLLEVMWSFIWRLCCFVDVDVDKPDEKSIMTYVAQFLKHYPNPHQSETDGHQDEVGAFFYICYYILSPCHIGHFVCGELLLTLRPVTVHDKITISLPLQPDLLLSFFIFVLFVVHMSH